MFHDLILALNGFTGDFFYLEGEDIKVRMDVQIPLLHPAEFLVINDILEIASLYKSLNDFVEIRQIIRFNLKKSGLPPDCGIYVSALCNGIREILKDYTEIVANEELKIIEDPHTTLNHIRVQLEPFRTLFRTLNKLTVTIKNQQKSSSVIVEIVKSEYDGNVHLQDSLQKLIPWMNQTLYRHITNWVVYGTIADPFEEFFIQKRKSIESATDSAAPKSKDRDHGKTKLHHLKLTQKFKKSQYLADYSLVPSHFSSSLVEQILFIGNSVSMLANSEKTKNNLLAKQEMFYERMKDLPVDTFRTEDLYYAIQELAVSIGSDLHQVVVIDANLSKHVGMIKDFYLTGRGELFHDFLTSLMQTSNTYLSSNKIDLRNIFALSATRVQIPEDILQRIEIKFSSEPSPNETIDSYLSKIALEMELEWPLHVLFTEESLHEYNKLFGFLLQVRLIQLGLNSIWASTKKVFRFPIQNGPGELKIIMSYFIDHLQHYMQADVLETQYSLFVSEIEKSENFNQIRESHLVFLRNISSQSFRNEKRVHHFIVELFKVCNGFIKFMRNHITECEQKNLPIIEGITTEILMFTSDFKKTMELLLNLLKGLASNAGNSQNGHCLGQFLLRLDYNSYFSSMMGD